ncbi:MAG: hypothetical protein J6Z02_08680 [Lachnospiraceae bacterium]|nr:hypothetical protein [Lachnospiraceae bacterium]
MSEYLKDFFALVLAFILIVAAPLRLFAVRNDTVKSLEALESVALFSEQARQEGIITKRELTVLSEYLALRGYGLDVVHEEKVVEGHIENGIFIKTGSGYYSHTFSEIEEKCDINGAYEMKTGDRLYVKAKGKRGSFHQGGLVLNETS